MHITFPFYNLLKSLWAILLFDDVFELSCAGTSYFIEK